ncbi:MAG: N-formylglutamate deformylase [Luteimonas sp.]
MTLPIFHLHRGSAPLLISIPHDGAHVPDDIAARLTDAARRVPDTDWHVARLYDFAKQLGASLLVPTHSRYVIDLNRAEDDVSLYPGQNTTGLCPLLQFSGQPLYRDGLAPTEVEVRTRVDTYWRPYHAALRAELDRLRARHERVVLWEAHSIRGVVPFLFDGTLPDLNLGTANGRSCAPALQQRLVDTLDAQSDYSHIANGRFKGGHITRHYGDPHNGIDAVQLEISQSIYMDEATFAFDDAKAAKATAVIRQLLETCMRSE